MKLSISATGNLDLAMTNTSPIALPNPRVLEVASLIPGPYCGKLLASLGAKVIKAEPLLAVFTR